MSEHDNRNLKQELQYHYYYDPEDGQEDESIDYKVLVSILSEYHTRIQVLEEKIKQYEN